MRHLKKFNESSDNKLELLRDVFENLEDEFDVDVEYTHSGVSIYNSNAKSVSVSIKLRDYITPDILDRIVELTNMSLGYCGLNFNKWEIYSGGNISTLIIHSGNIAIRSREYSIGRKGNIQNIESIKNIFECTNICGVNSNTLKSIYNLRKKYQTSLYFLNLSSLEKCLCRFWVLSGTG